MKKITSLLVVSDKDYKKSNKVLKGIIHIHTLLQSGIKWHIEKKLRIIQISLLILGTLIILFTYFQKKQSENRNIISEETQKKISDSLSKNNDDSDVFYDISYTGIDLSGNRYILKSQEARNNKSQVDLINMKGVNAIFYFKDGTVLKIKSKKGLYNNKTLDIKFESPYKHSTRIVLYTQNKQNTQTQEIF